VRKCIRKRSSIPFSIKTTTGTYSFFSSSENTLTEAREKAAEGAKAVAEATKVRRITFYSTREREERERKSVVCIDGYALNNESN